MTLPAVIKVEQITGFDGLPATASAQQWGQDRPVTLFTDGTLATPDGIVKPNIGRSIRDVEATDGDSESLTSWQERNNVDPSKQVRLLKLAHMRYQHPDLDTITTFLKDFGMHIAQKSADGTKIWFRGYGPDQYVYYAQKGEKEFLGGAFEVESMAELEKASQIVGASGIMEMKDAPGGGHLVTLTDPEGFKINLIYGLSPADPAPECFLPAKLLHNNEQDKPRVRAFNRYSPGPAAVHKLGHYGLCVRDFDEQLKWYTTHFNLAPTDFLYVVAPDENNRTTDRPAKKNVGLFAHIDRGDQPVDHHTFFMTSNPTSHVHHCSFEVHDYDTQHLGHQWLANKQYTSVWGIGRHVLGSQVFDYWWDTTGNMIEHYADGDLVNNDTPIGWSNAGDESLAVWGPEVPKWFLE